MNAVAPGSRATSAVSYERKACRVRCARYNGGALGPSARRVRVATGRRLGAYGVTTELVAHRGDRLHRRAVLLLGDEPSEERGRDRGHRHRVVDRRLDGPATLTGVSGVSGDLVEVGVLLER